MKLTRDIFIFKCLALYVAIKIKKYILLKCY